MQKSFLTVIAIALTLTIQTGAHAATWAQVRDKAMSLREAGRVPEAYALATSVAPSSTKDKADQQFVAGYLALRGLRSPDAAARHFTAMAHAASPITGWHGESAKSKAGYWLAEALSASGRDADAKTLYTVASGYRDTFYGMVAASKVGATTADTTTRVSRVGARYPRMPIAWHDSRVASELVFAVIKAESEFAPKAVSPKGAQGLMQVMPNTAHGVGRQAGIAIDIAMLGSDGNYNVAIGSKFLADLVSDYGGNIPMAAAAYNAGPKRVEEWVGRFGDPRGTVGTIDWIETIPFRETREYVQKVYSNYLSYLAIRGS